MSIRIKRCFFSIALIFATSVSLATQSQKGFNLSIYIICVPLSLLFLYKLILPELTSFDKISDEYKSLSIMEKVGSLVNLLLIIIWIIAQVYCLSTF
ncbi:hypothetical protein GCM10008904_00510 [Paraclostridium ghonii]|uniref:Membrane protein YesL n=1 Tax=Paraclostridium ghonii TaxID=29358 RepID=A0ABU0MYC0_9FIRM|nr:hypothetical protein [Paeniclostridium ghonii]MDQ0555845.1 putative membrane protein YesL [Paeniclostridium ghonii]